MKKENKRADERERKRKTGRGKKYGEEEQK